MNLLKQLYLTKGFKMYSFIYVTLSVLLLLFTTSIVLAETQNSSTKLNFNSTNNSSNNKATLYSGEKIKILAGYPAIIKYLPGNKNKPLVVFVPGASHLARISYGYPGGNKKDFLEFWLHKEGYPFLAVSYPIENKVFSKVYPNFTITDWADQITLASNFIIKKHHLSKNIVILAWSFAGYTAVKTNKLCKNQGLNVVLFIGLSADPPLRGLFKEPNNPILPNIKMLPNGMVSPKPLNDWFDAWFINQLNMQDEINKHVIIPKGIYQSKFIGNLPVALLGTQKRYNHGKFINDINATLQDTQGFDYSNYPPIAVIYDTSYTDDDNAFFTPHDWSSIISRNVYYDILKKTKSNMTTGDTWRKISDLVLRAPKKFTIAITPGNHFFFIGEIGAKRTALIIKSLIAERNAYNTSINKLAS
ncbi:MAG: hypothetical protein A3E87_06110 [Gammaproteobacteria bacterium RIFCSPHIGHO2_12_FULL_35_23]|nr:MAG: hypothetical protein A3E87_06110 [Gammaproteobacteria bacterium RIFCSPHIGHO2_12_FULL_35_23]